MLQPGTLIADRYEVGDRIGSGGMADVHRAHDRVLDRAVAVKILPRRALDGERGRNHLEREAVTTAEMNHPNVVSIHDAVGHDGATVLVMELLPGRTLADVCRAGPVPVEEAIRLADGMAAGLSAAHAVGLVHRDVKPANVLLDGHGTPKLADFGIARSLDATAATVTVRGSVPYVAPEQVRGADSEPRTDLYALGVVLFELLAGRPPYRGTPSEIVAGHLRGRVPDIRDHRDDVPDRLASTLDRLLAKNPEARLASADELRSALAEVAERPSTGSTSRKTATPATAGSDGAALAARERRGRTARGRRGVLLTAGTVGGLALAAVLAAAVVSGSDPADADSLSAVPVGGGGPAPAAAAASGVDDPARGESAGVIRDLRMLVEQGERTGRISDEAATRLRARLAELDPASAGGPVRDELAGVATAVDALVDAGEMSPSLADEMLTRLG